MDTDATLLGRVAHIRSPVPAGPRYDPTFTNEQGRRFENLILLCSKHHIIVDDQVDEYPVERLETMKAEHERIYTGAADRLRELVGDITAADSPRPAATGSRMADDLTEDQLAASLRSINSFFEALRQVPVDARSTLSLLVQVSDSGNELPIHVLLARADHPEAALDHLKILEHFRLVDIDAPDDASSDYDPRCTVAARYLDGALEIKELARSAGLAGPAAVARAIVELDFTVFDED